VGPALDLAGNVMPNYSSTVVPPMRRRGGAGAALDRAGEATGCSSTRRHALHPEKRERAIEILRRRFPHLVERAEALRGCWRRACGSARPARSGHRRVVCAHVGFDGLSHVKRLWQGGMVGKKIKVAFWRISARDIPAVRRSAPTGSSPVAPGDDWVCSRLTPA